MKITEDHIRIKYIEDYIGNVFNGETIHGLKQRPESELPAYSTFCGLDHRWSTDDPPTGSPVSSRELAKIAEKITCKRCRSILGLSYEHSEKPDYFLIIDTSVSSLPSNVTACETLGEIKEYIKKVIQDEDIDLSTCNTDRFRVVGVKEVSDIRIDIIPKGYDVILTKQ